MSTDLVPASSSPFDRIRRQRPDGSEFWSARQLQGLMAYAAWQNFRPVIARAQQTASNTGMDVAREFVQVAPLMGAHERSDQGRFSPSRVDYELSRAAAYLVAMNGDPAKPEVAAAQEYFVVRTREAETRVARLAPATFDPSNLRHVAQLAQLAADQGERLAIQAPMVAHAEHHRAADGLKAVGDFANDLKAWAAGLTPPVKVKHEDVWDQLGRLGIVIRGETIRHNQPTAKAIEQGLCKPKVSDFDTPTGVRSTTTTRLTPKGEGYAWDRITAYVEANGTCAVPRQIGDAS